MSNYPHSVIKRVYDADPGLLGVQLGRKCIALDIPVDDVAEFMATLADDYAKKYNIDFVEPESFDVDIDWDHQYDDWWTSRKGGYEVTYEYGDEDTPYHPPWVTLEELEYEPDAKYEPIPHTTKISENVSRQVEAKINKKIRNRL